MITEALDSCQSFLFLEDMQTQTQAVIEVESNFKPHSWPMRNCIPIMNRHSPTSHHMNILWSLVCKDGGERFGTKQLKSLSSIKFCINFENQSSETKQKAINRSINILICRYLVKLFASYQVTNEKSDKQIIAYENNKLPLHISTLEFYFCGILWKAAMSFVLTNSDNNEILHFPIIQHMSVSMWYNSLSNMSKFQGAP
ncbi:hypothetical protein E5288_WYG019449 [Bos mutus]|uniref:Uncharacterized protein n=1 Tax=Bos mutus TaxID=72004 RepID=A0A6B0S614_9CETA|nr:hypothetical protein [Bos mutus]